MGELELRNKALARERDEFKKLQDLVKAKDAMIAQKEEKAAKILKEGEKLQAKKVNCNQITD